MEAVINRAADHIDPVTGVEFWHHQMSGLRPPQVPPFHTHEFCEVFLIESGRLTHVVNGRRQMLTSGCLVFVRPQDRHDYLAAAPEPSHRIYLAFGLDTLRAVIGYLGGLFHSADFFDGSLSPCFALNPTEKAEVTSKLLRVGRFAEQGAPETRGLLRAVLGDLFARYVCGPRRAEPAEEEKPEWLDHVCRQMRKPGNFTEGLPALRRLAHKNARYLASVFQQHLRMTPTEFVNGLRLEHAAELLGKGDGKIIGVADRCGFPNLSHFYHMFKRRYGMPPGQYRRQSEELELHAT